MSLIMEKYWSIFTSAQRIHWAVSPDAFFLLKGKRLEDFYCLRNIIRCFPCFNMVKLVHTLCREK
ncbi:hypothetical protein SUBVAR_04863 [Subdoligranulum variabile DSM 15176]|uniref:Uncharacterized protein n=1 Tax=Subdoligranulum variabile DSM 15176 TaxID=411471 RepID=D1PKI7_9FIRM|nr:hypothetical protein SUBVAR_04863 [Subdoligranulum variabile DSM 15176]